MPGRMLSQAPEAPDSNEDSERSQVGEESGAHRCRLHRGSTTPETWMQQALEIPSDLPGFGRERDRGSGAAAGDMLSQPPRGRLGSVANAGTTAPGDTP